jgi:hypothetical protein
MNRRGRRRCGRLCGLSKDRSSTCEESFVHRRRGRSMSADSSGPNSGCCCSPEGRQSHNEKKSFIKDACAALENNTERQGTPTVTAGPTLNVYCNARRPAPCVRSKQQENHRLQWRTNFCTTSGLCFCASVKGRQEQTARNKAAPYRGCKLYSQKGFFKRDNELLS